jgi:hypothetical protein
MVFIRSGVLTKNALSKYGPFSIPLAAFFLGLFMDRHNNEFYRSYHNRSALYGGRDLKPGERIW